jgi:uncharacterized protein YrzB (UPF0473 family)
MQSSNLDEQTITLESEDGKSYACRILGVFEFDGKEYALLLNLGDSENEEERTQEDKDASTVIMQLIEQNEQAIFRTIESDEEFERVVAYVKELATEMTGEDDDEE